MPYPTKQDIISAHRTAEKATLPDKWCLRFIGMCATDKGDEIVVAVALARDLRLNLTKLCVFVHSSEGKRDGICLIHHDLSNVIMSRGTDASMIEVPGKLRLAFDDKYCRDIGVPYPGDALKKWLSGLARVRSGNAVVTAIPELEEVWAMLEGQDTPQILDSLDTPWRQQCANLLKHTFGCDGLMPQMDPGVEAAVPLELPRMGPIMALPVCNKQTMERLCTADSEAKFRFADVFFQVKTVLVSFVPDGFSSKYSVPKFDAALFDFDNDGHVDSIMFSANGMYAPIVQSSVKVFGTRRIQFCPARLQCEERDYCDEPCLRVQMWFDTDIIKMTNTIRCSSVQHDPSDCMVSKHLILSMIQKASERTDNISWNKAYFEKYGKILESVWDPAFDRAWFAMECEQMRREQKVLMKAKHSTPAPLSRTEYEAAVAAHDRREAETRAEYDKLEKEKRAKILEARAQREQDADTKATSPIGQQPRRRTRKHRRAKRNPKQELEHLEHTDPSSKADRSAKFDVAQEMAHNTRLEREAEARAAVAKEAEVRKNQEMAVRLAAKVSEMTLGKASGLE
jgi:hypothetical protein